MWILGLVMMLMMTMRITAQRRLCTDTCAFRNDRQCNDGGLDSVNAFCQYGTDCRDYGARVAATRSPYHPRHRPPPSTPPSSKNNNNKPPRDGL